MGVFVAQSFRLRIVTTGLTFLWCRLNPFCPVYFAKASNYGWSLLARSVGCWADCFWVLGAAKMWASGFLHDIYIGYHYTDQWSINKMLPSGCWYIILGLSYLQTKWSCIWDCLTIWVKPFSIIVMCFHVMSVSSMKYYVGSLTNLIIFAHHHNSILFWSNFCASSSVHISFSTEVMAQIRIAT